MKIDRRSLIALLPALLAEGAAISALGQTAAAQATPNSASGAAGKWDVVPSGVYEFDKLPVENAATSTTRAILHGKLATGGLIEVHETTLAPGGAPHPPHHHKHTEMFLVRECEAEVTISGKAQRVTAGGIAYVRSNDEHGIANKSDKPATYFVVSVSIETELLTR
ncbi:MAG: cupin domain-containing protein [Candidatus Acidiferrum sp.]